MLREHGQIVKKVQVSTLYHVTFTAFRPQPVAIPLPPQCAHWGTFPSGEGIAPAGRNKNTRHCETSPQTGRGNPPDFPAFSLEIVTFYHSTTGLPRRFAPRNDVVIFTFKQHFIVFSFLVWESLFFTTKRAKKSLIFVQNKS